MGTLITVVTIISILVLVYVVIKDKANSKVITTENSFEQAGVKVLFDTGKITIKNKTYDVKDVTGIETIFSQREHVVVIKVDDFNAPLHKIKILGRNEADKFTQRLSTALRKAGGASFY